MSIISASDFVYQYVLPNRTQATVQAEITWYITKYEPELLIEMLGADLYSRFIAGLAEDPIDTKWATIRDMVKTSIICYVYWWYRHENATQTGGAAESIPVNENGDVVSPEAKMMERWNEMVDGNIKTVNYIHKNPTLYGVYEPSWATLYPIIPSSYRGRLNVCIPDIFKKQSWL